ncbi:hypothetical protein AB6A23_23530 [Paenibacillus tarimensis]
MNKTNMGRVMRVNWLTGVFGRMNDRMGRMSNRTKMVSFLTAIGVGVGATAIGMVRQRRAAGNRFQQMLDPIRRMF